MATQAQKDEAWNMVLDEIETWARLRRQPDCPRETQIQLDDLLSQAPLIKAAPDLVAALEEMVEQFGGMVDSPGVEGPACLAVEHAKAALAKASAWVPC